MREATPLQHTDFVILHLRLHHQPHSEVLKQADHLYSSMCLNKSTCYASTAFLCDFTNKLSNSSQVPCLGHVGTVMTPIS